MEHIDRLDLDQAAPGIYAIRSSSGTVYIVDHDPARATRLMRATGPGTQSASEWDNECVPHATVESAAGTGVIEVGSPAKWLADPDGAHESDARWRLSRVVTSIERWEEADLEAFLAQMADQRSARLDEALDQELSRWASVLERLGREDEPSTPNAEIVERMRGQDRSGGPGQQDILETLHEARRRRPDHPPQSAEEP